MALLAAFSYRSFWLLSSDFLLKVGSGALSL